MMDLFTNSSINVQDQIVIIRNWNQPFIVAVAKWFMANFVIEAVEEYFLDVYP